MVEGTPDDLGIDGIESPSLTGSGGFAAVYRAFQPAFQRTVAVKVLAAPQLDDAARQRFERECRAMGSLSEHPSIVTLFDAGFTRANQPYLVMAYMAGGSLGDRIERAGALGWEEAVQVGMPVADALATAHRAGVLHRDVKPANVLLSRYDTVHLADFGIARLAADSNVSSTINATVAYAPPEVLLGGAPSPAADLYALGVSLYEVITGGLPFPPGRDEQLVAWIRRISDEPVPDLRRHLVPDDLCQLLVGLMAKEPADRPASASAVAAALQGISRVHGLDGRAGGGASAPPTPPTPPAPPAEAAPAQAPPAPVHPTPSGATTVAATPWGAPTTPVEQGWWPTHRVPPTGLPAWTVPDAQLPPATVLDPWLDVQVLEWAHGWAHVRCANTWECWVDGRLLEQVR